MFNFIDIKLTVNVTFNFTVKKLVELKNYIKNKLYLQDNQLNYKHIPFEFYYEDKFVNTH